MITINASKVDQDTGYTTDILVEHMVYDLDMALEAAKASVTKNGANEILITIIKGRRNE